MVNLLISSSCKEPLYKCKSNFSSLLFNFIFIVPLLLFNIPPSCTTPTAGYISLGLVFHTRLFFPSATTSKDSNILPFAATFKDIIRCLTDFKYREHIIESIQDDYRKYFEEDISTLEELDEWSKPTKDSPSEKIGTRESKIEGILDRMTLLKRDFYLKMMFNKSPDKNVDFVDLMEQGKVVLIRLPQSKFKKYVKNVICTFLITKLWTSAEIRGEMYKKPTRSHIIVDELSQIHTAEMYLDSLITETRKYGFKLVLKLGSTSGGWQ